MKFNQFSIVKTPFAIQQKELASLGFIDDASWQKTNLNQLFADLLKKCFPQAKTAAAKDEKFHQLAATSALTIVEFLQTEPLTLDVFYAVGMQLLGFEVGCDFSLNHPLEAMDKYNLTHKKKLNDQKDLLKAFYLLLNTRTKNGQIFLDRLANLGFFTPFYDLPAEKKPLFFNGKAQPVIDTNQLIYEVVYVESDLDSDGDGKAEMICKTADGTKDGAGVVIGNGNADYRDTTPMKLRNGSYAPSGRIISGPEYLTLFDGETGKALDTIDFQAARGEVSSWGDTWGNRCDRFTGCVAYLDGINPYACFGRGYYERTTMTTYKVENKKLKLNWKWDTGTNKSVIGYGDGNHHCMAADVDQDGRQEIVIGSAVLNEDGTVLNATGLAHGDAMHIGDFDPSNPGLEIFQCLEDKTSPSGKDVGFGIILRDAATARVLYRETASGDTGRAICDNIVTGNGGAEMNGSHSGNVYSCTGSHGVVCEWKDITKWGQNFLVYWSDVLERAVMDRAMVDQYGKGRVFTGDGVEYNNYTKSNPCLTCDLTGDWREEIIMRKSGGGLRVFTTTFESKYNIYTLMHNPQYRVQIASQNNGYNQPPHTDFYLDTTEYVRPEEPDVWCIK